MDNQLIFWYRVMTAHAEVIVLTNLLTPLVSLGFVGVCGSWGPVIVGKRVNRGDADR